MTFTFLYEGRLPVLFASVRCLLTQRVQITQFIVDTGACITCVPAYRAIEWGHSNEHPNAKPFCMAGIGGNCTGFFHSFRFGLVDPKKLWTPPLWESSSTELVFVENLSDKYGLLGMDVISQWKQFTIRARSAGRGGSIEIAV